METPAQFMHERGLLSRWELPQERPKLGGDQKKGEQSWDFEGANDHMPSEVNR